MKNLKLTLDSLGADILCLQETKIARDTIDEGTAFLTGYNSYFSFPRTKSGYSGVATYCCKSSTPVLAEEGLSGVLATGPDKIGCYGNIPTEFSAQELKQLDYEGRALITQHRVEDAYGSQQLLHVINVYCPRADPDRAERLQFKLKFYQLLEMRAVALRQIGHVVITGDINTSHREIDRCCQKLPQEEFENNPGRQWLNKMIIDTHSKHSRKNEDDCFQLVDSFRHFHPSQIDAYTCWNTQIGARATNYGSRIDYILVNEELLQYMEDSVILSDVMGSDHCPVIGHFRLKMIAALKLPSLCSKYYPEFAGTQSTLSSFLSSNPTASELNEPQHKKPKLDKGSNLTGKRSSQSNILGFFQRKTVQEQRSQTATLQVENCELPQTAKVSVNKAATLEAAAAWRQVLKGPQPPPLCSGHNEPCVERVVKKNGPNQSRRFWVCARGEGRANDANARCNFFKWMSSK